MYLYVFFSSYHFVFFSSFLLCVILYLFKTHQHTHIQIYTPNFSNSIPFPCLLQSINYKIKTNPDKNISIALLIDKPKVLTDLKKKTFPGN